MTGLSSTHGLTVEDVGLDGCQITEVRHRPALCISRHEHDALKICILLEGAFTERDGLNIRSPRAMDVLIRGPRRPHVNHYGGRGARSILVEIPPDHRFATGLMGIEGVALKCPATLRAATAVVQAFGCRGDRAATILGPLQSLLKSIAGSRRLSPPVWLESVREYVAEHWAEPLRLNQLAGFASVHPVYLSQAFRHVFGQTLSAYLHGLRLFHATELLKTSANLSAIAVDCGFFDQSHFTHAFERQHQTPPGLYRKALAQNAAGP